MEGLSNALWQCGLRRLVPFEKSPCFNRHKLGALPSKVFAFNARPQLISSAPGVRETTRTGRDAEGKLTIERTVENISWTQSHKTSERSDMLHLPEHLHDSFASWGEEILTCWFQLRPTYEVTETLMVLMRDDVEQLTSNFPILKHKATIHKATHTRMARFRIPLDSP